jgi:hypothetical protein
MHDPRGGLARRAFIFAQTLWLRGYGDTLLDPYSFASVRACAGLYGFTVLYGFTGFTVTHASLSNSALR